MWQKRWKDWIELQSSHPTMPPDADGAAPASASATRSREEREQEEEARRLALLA